MKQELSDEALELYSSLVDSGVTSADLDEFVASHGEDEFIRCSQDYFQCGEEYGFDCIKAFIDEFGIELFEADHFLDSYIGRYGTKHGFVKELAKRAGSSESWQKTAVMDSRGSVDWDATFDNLDEYVYHPNGFVFSCRF